MEVWRRLDRGVVWTARANNNLEQRRGTVVEHGQVNLRVVRVTRGRGGAVLLRIGDGEKLLSCVVLLGLWKWGNIWAG